MAEHGTPECWDEGCRRFECVTAQRQRKASARVTEVQVIVEAMLPEVLPDLPPTATPADPEQPSDFGSPEQPL